MAVVKEGHVERWLEDRNTYSPGYAKLFSNGSFQWFDSKDAYSPIGSVDVKIISAFLAFGPVIHQIPSKPSVFSEADIERSFGVPLEATPSTKVNFFRCSSQAEMASWMEAVNNLLFNSAGTASEIAPKNTAPVQSGNYGQPYGPPMGGYSQMPGQPGFAPPPMPGGYNAYPGPSQPPSYPGFPQQPPPPMGVPYAGTYPAPQPPMGGTYPPPQPGMPGPAYYPGGQQPMGQQQQVYYDKKGKPYTIVYKDGKPKKKKWKKAALGLAAGAASGYIAGKMLGGLGRTLGYGLGGWGGGWGRPAFGYGGFGRCGSWSSLSSFSSGGWSS